MSRSSAGAPCTRYLRTGFDKSLRQFYEWARRAVSTRAHCRRASSTPAEIYTALCQYRAADKKQKRRRSKKDRKSTRLNSSHVAISYAVFCLKKKKTT